MWETLSGFCWVQQLLRLDCRWATSMGPFILKPWKIGSKNDTGSSAAHDWCAGHISLGHRWRDSQLWNVNEMKRTLTSIPLLLILAMNLPILVRSGCLDVIVVKKKNQIWLPPNPMVSHPQVHGVSIWWHRHTFPCGESSAPRCHTVNALDDWIYIGISIVA